MNYTAELGEAQLFVDFDDSSLQLIVKVDSLKDIILKTYDIVIWAEDECSNKSEEITVSVLVVDSADD